jgi:hypothetical protein
MSPSRLAVAAAFGSVVVGRDHLTDVLDDLAVVIGACDQIAVRVGYPVAATFSLQ